MTRTEHRGLQPPKTLRQRLSSMRGQQIIVILTFMAVPLFLLFLFTYLPFAKMIQFSFFDMDYLSPGVFVGLHNYIEVFTRSDIFPTLGLMVYYLIGAFIQLALALLLATILSFKIRGGGIFKALLFLPFLINGIAVGFIFKFFFTHGFVFDTVLTWLGFHLNNLPYWLKDTSVNNIALTGTSVWRYLGQNIILFIGAIMSVNPDLYEAAEIDGANAWHKFMHVILPGIKTIVILNLILSISGSISVFEPPYVITKGSFGTATYFVKMDSIAHADQKVGLASAMAVILMIIIVFITLLQLFVQNTFLDEDKNGMTFMDRHRHNQRLKVQQREQTQAKAVVQHAAKGGVPQ